MDKSVKNGATENLRREAVKQYMHYFRFWFLAAVILVLVSIIVNIMNRGSSVRGNQQAPAQRVFDEANVLSQEEEELLSNFIANQEERIHCDIVLVTIKEDIEGIYGDWYSGMRTIADDFYDSHGFGYNNPQGDGMLLLDNWEEGQMGSWLSTCGAVEWRFGDAQIDRVLNEVDRHMPQDPYGAYYAYVEQAANIMAAGSLGTIPFWIALLLPLSVMVIFVAVHLRSSVGKNTVAVTSYVTEEQIHVVEKRDAFIRKQVFTRRIPKNNGGGSGHGGGHHISGGGVSHGGGGHRR